MATVTGGKVAFSRTVQPASYESARAEAELAFVCDEGEDPAAVMREWGAKVRAAALEMLEMPGWRSEQSVSPARQRFRRRDPDDEIPF